MLYKDMKIQHDGQILYDHTNKKFINRFQFLEETASKEGKKLAEMSLTEMDLIWEKSKEFFR
jgi:XTP/dITP diphosphohydrolase